MDHDWHATGLTVGQVADRMRIAPSAVRWYADQGLLPHERVTGNQRRFFADVLCRVAMIRVSQQAGLSLEAIRTALSALPPGRPPDRPDWERLATELSRVVHGRITDLFTLLQHLSTAAHPDPERSTLRTLPHDQPGATGSPTSEDDER